MKKPRIGVSACLLGENVRYDGQNKLDSLIAETLSQKFEMVPVCPECEMGLGAPREPMHLEGDPQQPRLIANSTRIDLSDRMRAWCDEHVRSLEKENLCGFVFKSRSPSCGMGDAEVVLESGSDDATASGLFARAFVEHFPGLPIIDETLLQDPVLRVGFIERVLTLGRCR